MSVGRIAGTFIAVGWLLVSCIPILAEKSISVESTPSALATSEALDCALRLKDPAGGEVFQEKRVAADFHRGFVVEAKRRTYTIELDCGTDFEPVVKSVTTDMAATDVRMPRPVRRK